MSELVIVTNTSDSDSSASKEVTADCVEAGEFLTVIAGGAALSGSTDGVAIVATHPVGIEGQLPAAWTAGAAEINAQSGNWELTVYAVCALVN